MCFTQLNSFLLTTDGRVFSWGGKTACLGRKIHQSDEVQFNNYLQSMGADGTEEIDPLEEMIDEVNFP